MRAIKINNFEVVEIEAPLDDFIVADVIWDVVSLNAGRGIWVDDEGLFLPGVQLATIGARAHLPLPAYILGIFGENEADATMTVEEVRALVVFEGPLR